METNTKKQPRKTTPKEEPVKIEIKQGSFTVFEKDASKN